jgi:hypothetical protein
MNPEDIVFRKRPRFEDKDLKRFEERMKNIEWDNEKGKGVLSDEAIEKIAKSVVEDVSKKEEYKKEDADK